MRPNIREISQALTVVCCIFRGGRLTQRMLRLGHLLLLLLSQSRLQKPPFTSVTAPRLLHNSPSHHTRSDLIGGTVAQSRQRTRRTMAAASDCKSKGMAEPPTRKCK